MMKFLPLVLFLVLLPLVLVSSEEASMGKSEKEALYLAIQGFVGKWWSGDKLYPDPCGWTPIQGVSCDIFDGLWYVTSLNIGPVFDNSLECSKDANFVPSLFNLKHLKTLSVYECFNSNQNAVIPSLGWENLKSSLETLEFRSNPGLTGEIPSNIGSLANLKSLVLVENSLSGTLPKELGNLVNLKRLSLEGNKLSGKIQDSVFYNLKNLLILDLSRNSLNGNIPKSVGGMSSILKLDFSNNDLTGSLPEEIDTLKTLTLLDIRNNNISGNIVQALQGLASIQDLLLSNNPLVFNLTEFDFSNLQNLTNLDMSTTGLTGTIPNSLARLKKLRFLALDNNNLRGSVLQTLEELPNLSALYINGNKFTGKLEFSNEFYQRMGRRFASWGNPELCYGITIHQENSPIGVEECKDQEGLLYN